MAKQAPDTDKGRDTVQDQTRFQHISTLGLQQLINKIIDNDSHYRLVGSAHSARPTSAGCSNYSTE